MVANFGPVKGFPTISIEIAEPEDTEMLVRSIVSLAGAGVAFKASEARAKVKMGDPERDDEIFGGRTVTTGTARQKHLARDGGDADHRDAIDDIREDMMGDWEPVMGELMAPFLDAVGSADSYDDARARLDAIDGFPASRLIDELVKGTFTARALGDVQDG